MKSPVALVRDPIFLDHDPGPGHPETARRLEAVYESLDADPIAGTTTVAPREATRTEIRRIHQPPLIDSIERTAGLKRVMLDPDTATSPCSYEAALKAAGATIQAVETVVDGDARGAFALVRPPGHHAESDHVRGFCLFNNAALAAAHAIHEGGLKRVLVIDPDVHHGNGTQHSFWQDAEVLYVSSHRYPFFPGTGALNEIGEGPGRGYTINMPLQPGTGDTDLLYLYEHIIGPVVSQFLPELIIVSAGFDTWHDDPLGGLRISKAGFEALFALFRRWAERLCPGRLVCTLEGGYDPAGVVIGVRAAIEAMTAEQAPDTRVEGHVTEHTDRVAYGLWRELTPVWSSLAQIRV